jgi:BirA family transcriptional regulator, biotin operon repressor / biotin---[acetyl-CoA-carboxylase] ligase
MNVISIPETHSTNDLLRQRLRSERLPEGTIISTDFQTDGKGQVGNTWESEAGKNLLFSMVLYPVHIEIEKQFIISQIVSLAIKNTLELYTSDICIKWPNDIYWKDKKIAGILIENSLQKGKIQFCIIGIGLNVNQTEFKSDAPNPISLSQINAREYDREKILLQISSSILELYANGDFTNIQTNYFDSLYRNKGWHSFRAENEIFEARIAAIKADGMLELKLRDESVRGFYFKEVEFVLTTKGTKED